MTQSRRDFLKATSAAAAALSVSAALPRSASGLIAPQHAVGDPAIRDLALRALDAAKSAGAEYADVRISQQRNQSINTRERRVQGLADNETMGFGVRALVGGAWGFAASRDLTPDAVARVAQQAVAQARANRAAQLRPITLAPAPNNQRGTWRSDAKVDPFTISIEDKVALLLAANEAALKVPGARFVTSGMFFLKDEKTYANTDGAMVEQTIFRTYPTMNVTAVASDNSDFQSRESNDIAPMGRGYEHVTEANLVVNAARWASEAVEKLKAKPVDVGRYDLVLHPTHLWLTIHESVAHPTELDRAMGYEANYAGTSFVSPPEKVLGKLRYGPEIMNIQGDRSQPGSLSAAGWDDDGVVPETFDIIKKGIVVDYQTTREQAPMLDWWYKQQGKPTRSHGCSYAQSWSDVQFQRMPNVNLLPGAKDLMYEDLIAATDRGIAIVGNGSFSIDQQRYNAQFGGQLFYEIKGGKVVGMLKDVAYQMRTPEFWNSMDMIGGKRSYFLGGAFNDGKGQPSQSNAVSHGCVPTRFRNVNVINTGEKGVSRDVIEGVSAHDAPKSLFGAPPAASISREDAQAIAKRTLGFATAAETRVTIGSRAEGNTRWAVNQVSTGGDNFDTVVTVRSAVGKRIGVSSTNRLDDAGLKAAVATAERLAKLVPEDPEAMPELEPQTYAESQAWSDSTANVDPAARATAVKSITDAARAAGMVATGLIQSNSSALAVANSKGLFAYGRQTGVALTTTVRTADGTGSGWAGAASNAWSDIDPAALGARAIEKAKASMNPVAIEPGRYTVILEPTAVGNLVQLISRALSARSADEGRSFFSKPGGGTKIGQKVVDERVTLSSDPLDPETLGLTFGGDGMPDRKTTWIENGVVKNLAYDRYWAAQKGVQPTSGGGGLRMSGGTSSLEEMIAGTQRGLLVTRFWYIRPVDPRTILYTGLTRDGTFLIENGKITRAVKNLRYNESPIFMLNNVEALGRPVRVSASEDGGPGQAIVVPPIKARDFTFTSLSDAV